MSLMNDGMYFVGSETRIALKTLWAEVVLNDDSLWNQSHDDKLDQKQNPEVVSGR